MSKYRRKQQSYSNNKHYEKLYDMYQATVNAYEPYLRIHTKTVDFFAIHR